jgi:lactate dehydrogenase-like 2-hydroxyacid dehydrogenase
MGDSRLEGSGDPALSGPAFDELGDVEVGPLEPRDDVEALIVANEPVDRGASRRCGSSRTSASATTGSASRAASAAIAVTNTPGVLDAATADLTWALILAARRRVVEGDRACAPASGRASWADASSAEELTGSGRLASSGPRPDRQRVARAPRRKGASTWRVLSVRFRATAEAALDELLAESGQSSRSTPPLTPETHRMIDARPPGAAARRRRPS